MGVIRHEKENAQKGRANTQAFSLFSQICIDEKTIWPMAAASPCHSPLLAPHLACRPPAAPRLANRPAALPCLSRCGGTLLCLPSGGKIIASCQLLPTPLHFFMGIIRRKVVKRLALVSWVDVWPLEVGLSLATFFVLGYLYQHPQMINAHCTLEHVPPLLAGPADPLDSQPSTICHWKSVQESRRDYQGIWQANLLRHHYRTFPHTKQIS